ncbi:NAD(P)H-dependent flavin oxidoreductase [Phenylobacterium soli]|uniref:Nitronate monooxygenase n=1 Tax=Phenylobacterium soli TaxID=2170551 RepID=A0A328AN23_9CAUL|nr:nitronate monooxygenase [Phenylobacterium soli]RAK55947.1 nitronate monooxygenase [Phenylobacterium soli]
MKTAFTDLLGVAAPLVQAPMGGATSPELAAAVSNAGGLGMLALSWHPPEAVRAEIRRTRELTTRPFGVNLVLAFPQDERLAVCLEEGVRLISFFWGDPAPFVARCHAAGALVASTVASGAMARAAAGAGVDVLVAQGWEAGGHVLGEVATLPLVRAVVEAAPDRPVLAAGGISDAHGLAAALALGAAGAWVGTRFLASQEAQIHPAYRARLIAADETATVHTSLFDLGWPDAPHRVLRNTTYEAWLQAGSPVTGARPGEGEPLARTPRGPLSRYQAATPGPDAEGAIEALSLWAGQGVSGVRQAQPAADIVRELSDGADRILVELGRRAKA